MQNSTLLTQGTDLFETDGFKAQLCQDEQSLQLVYKLRHRAYTHSGVSLNGAAGEYMDEYDQQSNTRSHLVWYEGKPVASVRISVWSERYLWESSEMIKIYHSEIQQHIGLETRFQESCRFVVDPEFKGRKSLQAQLLMFRIHALCSAVEQARHIVTGVREKHVPFYQRMLGFNPISKPRYVPWIDDDVVLLATSREDSYQTFLDKGGLPISPAEIYRYAELIQPIPVYA